MAIFYKGERLDGGNATINGQNTLEIVAGENVTIEQKDAVLTINATGGGTGGGSEGEVYSTEETRIGTWIDGKPLYRRIILTTSPSVTTEASVLAFSTEYKVVQMSGILRHSSGDEYPLPYFWDGSHYITVFHGRSGTITMKVTQDYRSCATIIVLEYTKTTD